MKKQMFYLCDMPEDSNVKPSPFYIAHKNGESRKVLFHYTSIESLLKISYDCRLKFSRIDKVDDLLEKNPLLDGNMFKRTFLACFDYEDKESIPLWKMYTKQGLGFRIGFYFKNNRIHRNFIDFNRNLLDSSLNEFKYVDTSLGQDKSGLFLKIQDIIYHDYAYNTNFIRIEEDTIKFSPDDFGLLKSSYWEFESETRMLLYVMSDEFEDVDIDFLLVPINIHSLDHIEIRFDPWMSKEMKECVRLTVNQFTKEWNLNIFYSDSILTGKIR